MSWAISISRSHHLSSILHWSTIVNVVVDKFQMSRCNDIHRANNRTKAKCIYSDERLRSLAGAAQHTCTVLIRLQLLFINHLTIQRHNNRATGTPAHWTNVRIKTFKQIMYLTLHAAICMKLHRHCHCKQNIFEFQANIAQKACLVPRSVCMFEEASFVCHTPWMI
jgi:hypothetical protein